MGLKINETGGENESSLEIKNPEENNLEANKFENSPEKDEQSKLMNKMQEGLKKIGIAGTTLVTTLVGAYNVDSKIDNSNHVDSLMDTNKTEIRIDGNEIENENSTLISKFKEAYSLKENKDDNLSPFEKVMTKASEVIDNLGNPENNEDMAVKSLEDVVDDANEENNMEALTKNAQYGDEPPKDS